MYFSNALIERSKHSKDENAHWDLESNLAYLYQ